MFNEPKAHLYSHLHKYEKAQSLIQIFVPTISTSASALNEASSDPSSPPDTVHISENCIRKMKELQCGEGEKKLLRLSVNSGGCSGFKYVFDLDCTTTLDDRIFEKDGVKLIVDSFSYKFVTGASVDYEDTLIRSAFVVAENPSADKTCGCQNSFTLK